MYTQKIALSYWNQTPADKPLDLLILLSLATDINNPLNNTQKVENKGVRSIL